MISQAFHAGVHAYINCYIGQIYKRQSSLIKRSSQFCRALKPDSVCVPGSQWNLNMVVFLRFSLNRSPSKQELSSVQIQA